MSVNVCLPSYSIGADCYKDIAFYTRHFGSKVVVIGGKTAMENRRMLSWKALQIQILKCSILFGMAAIQLMKTAMT